MGYKDSRLFRVIGWAAITLVAVFLGKDFVLSVVNVASDLGGVAY